MRTGLELSLLLVLAAAMALLLSAWLTRMKARRSGAIGGGRTSRPSRVRLGTWRAPASAAAWGFFAVAVLLPWIALTLSALAPVAGKFSPSLWTLRNMGHVLGMADFHEALINSFILTVGMSTAVVAGGFGLAYLDARKGSRAARAVISALGIPFSAPGTVVALLLIMAGNFLARSYGLPTDGPLFLMAIAYSLKYAAVGARSLAIGFRQVHPSLEEAARVSGARAGTVLVTIWLPLLRRTLQGAWLLAALPMLTELTMSVLLTGPGGATLGTVLFQLQEYADQPSAAALAWMLLTAALAVGWVTRRKETE